MYLIRMDATQEEVCDVSTDTLCIKAGGSGCSTPVHLTEGQEIHVLILSEEDRVRAALGDLVVPLSTAAEEDVDEEALARQVEADFRGQPSLSETILEERRAGP